MTQQELMERHKIRSEVTDLTAGEMEVYRAFLELAETENDVDVLSRAWLKMHRRGVLGAVKARG